MADNTTLDSMTGGDVISTDDVAGVKVQRVKVQYGGDGVATDVDTGTPLPVTVVANTLATGAATSAKQDIGNTSVASIDTKTPALGQALAAASVPVILPAITVTALTPPAAITGFATSAKQDSLLTELLLKAKLTDTQPVSLASVPSHAVTNAGTFATQATLAAETTKVIGTVNIATAQTVGVVAGSALIGKVGIDQTTPGTTNLVALPTTTSIIAAPKSTTPAQTSVAGSATSVSLLASNANRKGATFSNDSTATLYLKLGATASTTSYTLKMTTDAYYEVPFGYTGAIDGIWSAAAGNVRITELT
jgi:hypothetical protein